MERLMSERPEGWELRLLAKLREADGRLYDVRNWNCARFAHGCAEAVSGRAIPFQWKGSLQASADAVLPRIAPLMASRGDVVLADVPEPTLGVCIGREALFVAADGLLTRGMREARVAWSV